jgi:hypothetical protein
MNRRRDEPRTSTFTIFAVILAFGIIAAGGVLHAYYKNTQIQVSREIDAIDRRVEHCRLDIRTTEMRMDLNCSTASSSASNSRKTDPHFVRSHTP